MNHFKTSQLNENRTSVDPIRTGTASATTRRSRRVQRFCLGLSLAFLVAMVAPSGVAHAMHASVAGAEAVAGGAEAVAGLQVKKRDVLWGNAHRSKVPAEIDVQQAIDATVEGRKVEDEGIEKGSARYDILMAKAHARVRNVVRRIAISNSRDCVVKSGSYRNPAGLSVVDLTSKVVDALGNDTDPVGPSADA